MVSRSASQIGRFEFEEKENNKKKKVIKTVVSDEMTCSKEKYHQLKDLYKSVKEEFEVKALEASDLKNKVETLTHQFDEASLELRQLKSVKLDYEKKNQWLQAQNRMLTEETARVSEVGSLRELLELKTQELKNLEKRNKDLEKQNKELEAAAQKWELEETARKRELEESQKEPCL